ncbi:MAG: hypothetical protein Q9165_007430 [Trypethelium subeluteriae]
MRTKSNSLCSRCAAINFNHYLFHEFEKPYELGTFDQIWSSAACCPFCRLVVAFLNVENISGSKSLLLDNILAWKNSIVSLDYDGASSYAYSNELDLKVGTKGGLAKLARVLTVKAKGGRILSLIHYLANKEMAEHKLFFGRRIDVQQVDWKLVQSWLTLCTKAHGRMCSRRGQAASRLPHDRFRVIDVEKGIIVIPTRLIKYFALSYVWGEPLMDQTMPRLKRANTFRDRNGSRSAILPKGLPATIEDAMTIVRRVGFPQQIKYLWVDALCIVQDDEKDRNIQVHNMDAIFSCAYVTIAVGSGLHANAGIPGVSIGRALGDQHIETVKGFDLAIPLPKYHAIQNNACLKWNERAWTLQEKLLSKRLLLFTDDQMYFKCSNAVWCEDTVSEVPRLSEDIRRRAGKIWVVVGRSHTEVFSDPFRWAPDRRINQEPRLTDRVYHFFRHYDQPIKLRDNKRERVLEFLPRYRSIVNEYSRRFVTERRDALSAVDGLLKSLDSFQDLEPFAFAGIPQRYFQQALLWQPRAGSDCYCGAARDENVPTWSWARWTFGEGCRWYPQDFDFSPVADGSYYLEWPLYMDKYNRENLMGFQMYAVVKGCSKAVRISPDPRTRLARKAEITIPSKSVVQSYVDQVRCVLFFRAKLVSFRVGAPIRSRRRPADQDQCMWFKCIDKEDECIGEVLTTGRVTHWLRRHSADFVLLSWGRRFIHPALPIPSKYIPQEIIYGTNGESTTTAEDRSKWIIGNVMLVKWDSRAHVVATRLALGKIINTAIDQQQVRERDIYLA